jgi:hypothetical protein
VKAAREDGALDEAKAFLAELLAPRPLPANEVKTEAAAGAGIAQVTLARAARAGDQAGSKGRPRRRSLDLRSRAAMLVGAQ